MSRFVRASFTLLVATPAYFMVYLIERTRKEQHVVQPDAPGESAPKQHDILTDLYISQVGVPNDVSSITVAPQRPAVTLTAQDRCDKCSAAAKYRYAIPGTGMTLEFCGHHSNEFSELLDELGWRIVGTAE